MAESVMPFSCRIRSTTARWSDLGATRCATSHTVSPAPTRVSAVSAGTTGLAAWPIQLAPAPPPGSPGARGGVPAGPRTPRGPATADVPAAVAPEEQEGAQGPEAPEA